MTMTYTPRTRAGSRATTARAASAALAGTLALAAVVAARPAVADTAPVPPETAATVSADLLPTVQVDGVVWSQLVVGTKVFVTGKFAKARPAGAAPGTNEVTQSNILAYDVRTGELVDSWNASLNAQGLALAGSSDGSRVYVGGDFTSVSGVARERIVALDATTGAVVRSFTPQVNAQVRTLAVRNGWVYAGGTFTTAHGQPRTRLAAFTATGAVSTWAPAADATVFAIVAPAGSNAVIAGGRFQTLAGTPSYGMGSVDAITGASRPWPANSVVRNAGQHAAIYSLATDGPKVYGTGYTYLVEPGTGGEGNFEGTFAASSTTGDLLWVTGCRGDSYASQPIGGVLYSVGHAHDCESIGGHPETSPRRYQKALAQTTAGYGTNQGGKFAGRPGTQNLTWWPLLDNGTITGQNQAAWSVAGSTSYVVLGGEFPRVNGVAQQGLARLVLRSRAPNKERPQRKDELTPELARNGPTVRATFTSSWDRDNRRLRYELLRGVNLSSARVVATADGDSSFWVRPELTLTDPAPPASTQQTYRVRATDPLGNVLNSDPVTIAVAGPGGPGDSEPGD